ncbi:hypothetical protein Rahaq_4499 (plasmid) [Rahnella aceris]|jgi:hypothetical protein|uniref:Uncharacterized protein n=1 Tax=Rahnella sp. (strain Y9602) TaxID=2703885 RepID=A0A0H3FM13_RAHSY|nr:hypothetical protein Rahaq_4499 [Rahnella aceris]
MKYRWWFLIVLLFAAGKYNDYIVSKAAKQIVVVRNSCFISSGCQKM